MSARALRRLREARDAVKGDLGYLNESEENEEDEGDDEDDDEDDDDDDLVTQPKVSAFAMMQDSSGEEESDDEDSEVENQIRLNREPTNESVARASALKKDDESEQEEEDIDAILAEFQEEEHFEVIDEELETSYFTSIVDGVDDRDLDFESVMRNSLLGMTPDDSSSSTNRRGRRQAFLFGQPKDGWTRPPHFVGGGIGMTSYKEHPHAVPWPYNSFLDDELEGLREPHHWFSFMPSDTFKNDLGLYYEIQQSGDVNALASFVIGNPFIPEALLQLSKVVYQTSQSAEALALLRRALWVYECSSLKNFLPHSRRNCYVDCDRKENLPFFQALFLMMQVSSVAGCTKTSTTIARYVLAMDPLRDPMSVLVALDFFALSANTAAYDMFVIRMVQSEDIKIYYRDSESTNFVGHLLDMPNWAFSYALALYRMEQSDSPLTTELTTAKDALVSAIRTFPHIVEQMLRKNEISTTGRSMYTDWFPVLESLRKLTVPPSGQPGYDPIVYYASKSASDLIAKVFVQRSFKLWGGQDVQKWLYEACLDAISDVQYERKSLSPALQRYARIDPADFEDRFRLLPAEANPLDPGLLAMSLVINGNRRQMLRRGDRGGNHHMDPLDALEQRAVRAAQDGIVIGGPPTYDIDPDSPLLEVLWQSMLPWNRVVGVPPPRR